MATTAKKTRVYRVDVDEHKIDHVTYEVESTSMAAAAEAVDGGEGKEIDRSTEAASDFDVRYVKNPKTGAELKL